MKKKIEIKEIDGKKLLIESSTSEITEDSLSRKITNIDVELENLRIQASGLKRRYMELSKTRDLLQEELDKVDNDIENIFDLE